MLATTVGVPNAHGVEAGADPSDVASPTVTTPDDAPPLGEIAGDNPLGEPTVEDVSEPVAPADEQPPSAAPDEATVDAGAGDGLVDANELIVVYKEGTTQDQRLTAVNGAGEASADYPEISTSVVSVSPPSAEATADERLSALDQAKAELAADPNVEAVEYDDAFEAVAWSPNDPRYRGGYQGNIRAVDAPRAWSYARGPTKVAVLDSGRYRGHVDLDGTKVVQQRDFAYNDPYADDRVGHGTHVASILAAQTNNGAGIVGGAPAAQIMCAKVTNDVGAATNSNILDGLSWALNNNAKVVNMSLAGGRHSRAIARLTLRMYNDQVFIAAAVGNDNQRQRVNYPAAYPGVMGVAGTERDGNGRYLTQNGGSNWGPYVDIAAPGESIWGAAVAYPNAYTMKSGTSMASPHVAAAGALLKARGYGAPFVHRQLTITADDRGPAGCDEYYGCGLVDFHGAVRE